MTRAAAAKALAAAETLLDWLRTQPRALQRSSPPDPVPALPRAAGPETPTVAQSAGHSEKDPGTDPVADADPLPVTSEPADRPAPDTVARVATQPGQAGRGAPLRLAHTDWLHHWLTIAGPDDDVAAFRAAAAGAGTIPWHLDLDRIEEDCFHLLVSPPPLPGSLTPHPRGLSLAGARIVAGQLRDAVARRHDLAVARVGRSRACPFDLHALIPVPAEVLQLGPDDPDSLAWLWENWGTTHALRHVTAEPETAGQAERRQLKPGKVVFQLTFWSADWTPWRALGQIAARWPALRFDLRPIYDAP